MCFYFDFVDITLMWIRMGFDVDPDPAFNLNADPIQGAKLMWIHADPDPGQTAK
jgi:hypothetical protein